MGVYSFRSGPTYRAANPGEQYAAAFDMPLSVSSTLGEQFKGGILDSLGLGTAIREVQLPDEAPTTPAVTTRGPDGELITLPDTPQMRRRSTVQGFETQPETQAQFNQRRREAGALDEAQYKASPYFRDGVKWDMGMTEDRAAALADAYDAKRVREYFASKRPFTAFLGNIAGQAIDPINYIPIAGPVVKAASVAKFGRIAGGAAVGALDAAANTALASGVTYDARRALGDDITWQSTVSDIAMAALIGSAFGTIGGVIDARRSARMVEARKQAETSLATLKATQDARIALNGAIDGLARGDDVALPANASEAVQSVVSRSNPVWSPDMFAPIDRRGLFSTTSVGRFVDNRPVLVQDAEGILRNQAMESDPTLATRYSAAEARFNQAQEAVAAIEEPLAARRQSDTLALVDEASAARMAAIEDELAGNVPSGRRAQLEAERDMIVETIGPDALAKAENDFRIGPQKQAKAARKALTTARQEFSKVRREVDTIADRIRAENRVRYQASVDMSPAKPEQPPAGRMEAETRVAKPETPQEASEQYRVNAEDGSYPEQADIEQARTEGRLTADDEATLTEADQTYENGVAYGEALKAVAGCFI